MIIESFSGAQSSGDDSAPVKPGASYIKGPSIQRIFINGNVENEQTKKNVPNENLVNKVRYVKIENESKFYGQLIY